MAKHLIESIYTFSKKYPIKKANKGNQYTRGGLLDAIFLLFVLMPGMALAQADLNLNLQFGPNPAIAGGERITYEVEIINDGTTSDEGATGVVVEIEFPPEILYDGFDGPPGVNCSGLAIGSGGGTLSCDLPDIPYVELVDQSVEFEVYGLTTIASGAFTFDVNFSVSALQPDPDPANNAEDAELTVNAGADLEITITGDATVMSGDVATYNVTVENHGPNDASGINFSYQVPAGTIYTAGPGACTAAPLNFGDTITCTVGSINTGNSSSLGPFSFQTGVSSGSDVTHTVTVNPGTPPDPNTDNNTDSFTTDVTGGSDVSITKTRSIGGPFFVGDTFNFILAPSYTGDEPQTLQIVDNVPSQYEIIIGSFDLIQNGWNCSVVGQEVTCTKASGTGAGVNVSLGNIEIPVEIISDGVGVTNTVTISSAAPADPDLSNNTASDSPITIDFPATDFSITKSGPSPALVVQNVPFDYTITARNNGPGDFVGDLIVTDNLPSGVDITGITASGWTCVSSNGDPASLDLPVSGVATITCERTYTAGSPLNANSNAPTITLTAETTIGTTGTPITNEAEISSANTPPGVAFTNNSGSGTNTVTTSTNPDSADLTVSKSVIGPDPVNSGDILTYRVELINNGPSIATDVVLTDPLPTLINTSTGAGNGFEGFTFTDGGAQYGVLVPGDVSCSTTSAGGGRTLTCDIDTFPVCDPGVDCPIIDIEVRPRINVTGNRTNTASIISNSTADPDLSNNSDDATSEVIAVADMRVTKVANQLTVNTGQQVTYDITAINDQDGSPSYSHAQDVKIIDTLPEGVVFVSASAPGGSCTTNPADGVGNVVDITPGMITTADSRTVECSWDTVNRNAQRTAQIVVKPSYQLFLDEPSFTNNVDVETSTLEPDLTNNSADVTVDLDPPILDLLISRHVDTVDPVTINDPEQDTVFEIDIRNNGPSDASFIEIINFLPSGLNYQSHTFTGVPAGVTTGCSETPPVGDPVARRLICEINRLTSGQVVRLEITARAQTKGTSTNRVWVRSVETHDSATDDLSDPLALNLGTPTTYDENYTNNVNTENITVRTRTDLIMDPKTPSSDPIAVGADFHWVATLTASNAAGLDEADDVEVTDNLPAGMFLTGNPTAVVNSGNATVNSCTGADGDTSFTCDFGTVDPGTEIDITIPVRVPEITTDPTDFTNTISVTTTSRDINTGNNETDGTVTIEGANISGFVYRDFDDDGLLNNNDTGISGITMNLTGTAFNGLAVSKSVTTDGTGEFIFTGLPASDGTGYTITRGTVSEDFLTVGQQTVIGPSVGNTGVTGEISGAVIGAQTNNPGYLFGYIPQPRIGLAKRVLSTPSINPDASFNVDFRVRVENYSLEPLSSIEVDDLLAGVPPLFGTFVAGGGGAVLSPNEYTIQTAPSFNGACATGTVNAAFDGSGNQRLADISTLPIGGSCEIDFTIRFEPPIPLPVGGYENQARGEGEGSWTGDDVDDLSQDGANPDPDSDGDPTNNDVPTPVVVTPIADVTTTITLSGTPNGNAGNDMSGTVLFRNAGPSIAENVAYSLTLSPNLQNLTFGNLPAGTSTSYNSGTGVVTFTGTPLPTSLAANQIVSGDATDPITFEYTQPGIATSTVSSTIATTTDQGANVLQDDDTETVTGIPIADVTTSVDFPPIINSGQPVSGTVIFTNLGPSTADGVTYQIELTPGLELLGTVTFGNMPGGATASYNDATGLVSFTGMPASVTINQIVSGNGTTGITVSYIQPGTELSDPPFATTTPPSFSNITSTISTTTTEPAVHETNTADAIVAGEFVADVTTSHNSFPLIDVDAGDPVTGYVVFTNLGPSVAENVTYALILDPDLELLGTVTFDNLPAGVTASYDNNSGIVTFTGMPTSLAVNEIASGDGVNGIEVNYIQPGPAISNVRSEIETSTIEPTPHEPNVAVTQPGGGLVVDVTTTVNFPAFVNAGETVSGTIVYRNNGPSIAEDVTYTLQLALELTNVVFGNLPTGATADYNPTTGIVIFTGMPTELDMNEIASGNGTSGITLSYTQPGDAFSEVESEIGTSTNQGANIAPDEDDAQIFGDLIADVTTSLDFPPTVDALTMVNGRVVYRNDGPSIASNVTYGLTLLPDLEDVSFGNLPGGATATYDSVTGIVTFTGMPVTLGIGEMASGDGTNGIEVNYRQPASGESEVDSEIGTSTDQGANVLPDTARVELDGRVADVTTEITISPEADAGETVTGTVLFENRGPSTASDVTYTLIFEPNLENLTITNLPAGATAIYDSASGEITFTGMPSTLVADQIASGNGVDPIGFSYTQPGTALSEVNSTIGTSTNQGANVAPDDATAIVIGELIADLAVTKTVSATSVEYNSTIQYTIRVVNNGPSPVPSGSTLEDIPDGVELTGASCSSADGNRCNTAPNISDLIAGTASLPMMPVGSFYEIIVSATVTAFQGTIENSVTVRPPANVEEPDFSNNTSSVTGTVQSFPSIGIAKSISPLESLGSGVFRVTFTIIAENLGNEGLTNVQITDPLSQSSGGDFGTYTPSGSLAPGTYRVSSITASGLNPNQSFNGDSDLLIASGNLSVGAKAEMTFVVDFVPGQGKLENQAKATGIGTNSGNSTEDISHDGNSTNPPECGPQPQNCTDPTPVLTPSIGVTKQIVDVTSLQDGRYDVRFVIKVANLGVTPLSQVQLFDDLTDFGTFTEDEQPVPGMYTIVGYPEIINTEFGANLSLKSPGVFNGDSEKEMLIAELSSLPNIVPESSTATIEFTIRFFPVTEGPFLNLAVATATGPDGEPVRDESIDDSNPNPSESDPTVVEVGAQMIGVAKEADEPVQTGLKSFLVTYRIIVANLSSSATATNVQVTDDLTNTFPTAESIVIENAARILSCSGTDLKIADPVYDGINQIQLLSGDIHLQPEERCTIEFSVEVDYGDNDLPEEPKLNQAIATTHGVPGGDIIASGKSDNGDIPAVDGDMTPVVFEPNDPTLEGGLIVVKTSSIVNVTIGQMVPFTIRVTNPHSLPFTNVELRDILPPGFQYRTGTATIDGLSREPERNGRTLSWDGLVIEPEQTITVRLILIVGAGVQPGEYSNIAQAFDDRTSPDQEDRPYSEVATATVRVVPDPIFECADIIGKVFLDNDGSNFQTSEDPGIMNVRIATARGWLVTTDADGKYHIACVAYPDPQRGSNFVLKLDESSLPEGYKVVSENPRTVRVTAGKVTEVNFGVSGPATLRIEMNSSAFSEGSAELLNDWIKMLYDLESELPDREVVIQVIYRNTTGSNPLSRSRVKTVFSFINDNWSDETLRKIVSMEEVIR